jgi:hypothetical protein
VGELVGEQRLDQLGRHAREQACGHQHHGTPPAGR